MKTYRLTLACEQDGRVVWEHVQIPEASVETVMKFLKDNAAILVNVGAAVQAARGARQFTDGLNKILSEGIRHRPRR